MIKYSLAIFAVYAMVVNGGDGQETSLSTAFDTVIQYTMPHCKYPVKEIFGLSHKPLQIELPNYYSPKTPQLSCALRFFYSRCNQSLDIRSIENVVSDLAPVALPALEQKPVLVSPLFLKDGYDATPSDYYFFETPSHNALLPVISRFQNKFEDEYARVAKELIGALIKPDIIEDGTQSVDLTLILPDIQKQIKRLLK